MRIIAGEMRGRTFDAPVGDGTRPTTDRVRESLMSSIFSARGTFDDAIVLDAFAGSGALGFEALSRGAARAVFYERDPKAFKTLSANAAKLGLESRQATCTRADIMAKPPVFSRPAFDLVFLDPPYAYAADDVLAMVFSLAQKGIVSEHAYIIYEHAVESNAEVDAAITSLKFSLAQRKKYGDTIVDMITVAPKCNS